MSTIAAGIARAYPAVKKDWGATVDRYLDRIVGQQMRLSLQILMWAVVAVLLIGCVNLANLLMARGTLRSREISLRLALGAGRGRIIRMLLTESLLIGAGGAAVGAALGFGLLRWIEGLMPPFFLPAEARVGMDYRVMLFLAAVTILTSIAFGFAPAVDAARSQAAGSLHEGSRGNSVGKGKLYTRHLFVAIQVAAAFVLLVGAGLLIRSFSKIMSVDTGFASEGLIAGSLPVPAGRYTTSEQLAQYADGLLREIQSSPGVREAGIASALPLRGWGDNMPMWLPEKPDERFGTGFKIVTPGYLRALGIRLVVGRLLDERDTAGAPLVVVVNETFVRRFFPGQNAIGKRILVDRILPSRRDLGARAAWEIVGVVADEKARGLDTTDDTGAYASFLQSPVLGIGVVVRGQGSGTGALIRTTQQAIWRVDKTQVLDDPKPVEEMKGESLRGSRLFVSLLAGFALLALVLASAGIYGVLSFVTARRTREMGIRAAMGATRGDLIRLVASGGAKPVFAGLAVGLAAAVGLGRFIETMLFDTRPADPLTLEAVGAVFLTVAMAACLIPALRAARAHPMAALRQD
jgi:predicted permease